MKTKRDEPEKVLTIRLPESLLILLRERAIKNNRSLNSEIIQILQENVSVRIQIRWQ